jgi:hypothetical protein
LHLAACGPVGNTLPLGCRAGIQVPPQPLFLGVWPAFESNILTYTFLFIKKSRFYAKEKLARVLL